jgi:hypothetical protein
VSCIDGFLILSGDAGEARVLLALGLGARGYLLNGCSGAGRAQNAVIGYDKVAAIVHDAHRVHSADTAASSQSRKQQPRSAGS